MLLRISPAYVGVGAITSTCTLPALTALTAALIPADDHRRLEPGPESIARPPSRRWPSQGSGLELVGGERRSGVGRTLERTAIEVL